MNKKSKLDKLKSYGEAISHNMVIRGSNHEVCGCLLNDYKEQVKCIYIDPPYNNGDEYTHYTDTTSHKRWIDNMSKTLATLFGFLRRDGSLWISIDDNELHYLKVLCDELFGRDKFVSTIVWQHRTTRENRSGFSSNHEYILLYAKDPVLFKKTRNLLPSPSSILERYKNPDNDTRGVWQSESVNVQAGHAVDSQFYTITAPNGTTHRPPNGRCWIYNEERMLKEIKANNIWFGRDGKGVPRKKKFLTDSKCGITAETLWLASDVGTTNAAKKHLLSLFPDIPVFDTPKPESLIKRIIEISTQENDLVLDAFLGSGTTAAVAHKMKRQYIGIDIGLDSIEYAVKRLKDVINGEGGGISPDVAWQGGGGFAHYEIV